MVVVVAPVRMVVILASPFLFLCLFFFSGLTVAGQETVVLRNLHEQPSIAVTVGEEELPVVASSVFLAESWLRTHVLSHFPSTNITTIVVGKDLNCKSEEQWSLVLPSVKNLHYSLVRWGLVRDIKVSVAFSHDCLEDQNHDLAEAQLKHLLQFLQSSNSIYTINPNLHFNHSPLKTSRLISTHQSALDKHGFPHLKITYLEEIQIPTTSRKLISSSFASSPYLEKRKPSNPQHQPPLPEPPSTNNPFAFVPYSPPSEIPGNPPDSFPHPPSSSSIFPPSPTEIPKSPPAPLPYPPSSCPSFPAPTPAPSASIGQTQGVWCVAKPAVPADTLQKGIDFACGEGGADCDEIKPDGRCYYPDNLVAHASYAYNSYWQKTKSSGGTCGFDGTAILIDSDPSFKQCRFGLNWGMRRR